MKYKCIKFFEGVTSVSIANQSHERSCVITLILWKRFIARLEDFSQDFKQESP